MNRRVQLQSKLEELLGSRQVYYQPPETVKMEYPAIVYSKKDIEKAAANNKAYMLSDNYELVVIDKRPDNEVIKKIILEFPMCSYTRSYRSENLNHDVINLYY